MTDRRDEDAPNYQHTFQWIYEGIKSENLPRHNFARWLQYGNNRYWMSGKAGSGKSTLMKYSLKEPRPRTLLSEWASGEHLPYTGFYFWNIVTSLQKSQLDFTVYTLRCAQ